MADNRGDWQFWCDGMHIVQGIRQRATNGFIGIDGSGELVLFDNKGNEFDRALIGEVEAKLKTWSGDSIKMNGTKYRLEFSPLKAALGRSFGALGAIAANAMRESSEDSRTPAQRRDEFAELVHELQGR